MDKEFYKNEILKLCALCEIAADGANIVITGHDMPDSDSIISAVMLRELLSRLGVAVKIKFGTRPDGVTERQRVKELIDSLERQSGYSSLYQKTIGALQRAGIDGWDYSDDT